MIFLGALPILYFILLYIALLKNFFSIQISQREIFLKAAIIWGLMVVLGTEILNLFHALTLGPVLGFWITLIILTAIYIKTSRGVLPSCILCQILKNGKLNFLEWVMIGIVVLIVLLVGMIAFMAPPNSWDAMTYHMSRVLFWKQNHSIDHYPTFEFRQLFFPPWTGYVSLHFQILTESDRFAPLVSWFSFLGSLVGVSLIAFYLGASRWAQIFAAFCVATIPTAIIEVSGVRIDMVVSFWIVTFAAFLLALEKTKEFKYVIFLGLSLGLGILTKGTIYLMAPPFVLWFSIILWKKFSPSEILKALFLFGTMILLINFGFFYRNGMLVGDPLGPSAMRKWGLTYDMSLPLYMSNIVRTFAYQLGNSIGPWNDFVVKIMQWFHEIFHVNIVDERTTYEGTPFHVSISVHEDGVTNFIQATLLLVTFIVLLRKRQNIFYILSIIAAFVILCTSIKWTNHITRYGLPLFLLGAVSTAMFAEKYLKERKFLIFPLVFVLIATSMPYVFKNNLRRIISSKKQTIFNTPRFEQYFRNDRSLMDPYVNAVKEAVESCDQIGLYVAFNHWDYPFWPILQNKFLFKGRLEHVWVNEFSPTDYPLGEFSPCALIAVGYKEPEIHFKDGQIWERVKDFDKTTIFRRKNAEDKNKEIQPEKILLNLTR